MQRSPEDATMVWARKSVPASKVDPDPTLIGLDLNASRARAVHGPAQALPRLLPLAGNADDLPMILSLQGRQAEVGQAGAALCRLMPHLTCLDFLAHVGEPREWVAGRHRLDALKALGLVFERLQQALAGAKGLVLAIPAYLTRAQLLLLPPLAEKAHLPLLGSVRAPLASALAIYRAEPWSGPALFVDADDHALTAAVVAAEGGQLNLHTSQSWTHLNLRIWRGRLLDAVADRCIRQSRRDPRDTPAAEQALYERIDDALDTCVQGRAVEFLLQTAHWYQHLLLQPEEIRAYCGRLAQQGLQAIRELLATATSRESLRLVVVSRAVGRLPGLVPALQNVLAEATPAADPESSTDFGEDLLPANGQPLGVTVQSADATAQAAHELAVRIQRGELPHGSLDCVLPLPTVEPLPDTGEAKKRTFRLLSFDL
ncbi:MAG TPA: hypothetical protein VKU02_16875 [Gemmataceae bacterium]|nr:hypothetical protein [Gemmataceae bacterium]